MQSVISEETPKDLFLASLERCASVERFIPAFYERFLGASDNIRARFRFTSFEKQNAMLLNSLRLSAAAISGDREALQELKKRAQSHSRDRLDINPALYDVWLSALIETAAETDPLWSQGISDSWRTVLGFVIKKMVAGY